MDKTFGLNSGKCGVQIPGRGKCSQRNITVNARIKYSLFSTAVLREIPTPLGFQKFLFHELSQGAKTCFFQRIVRCIGSNSSASMAWEYADLISNLYSLALKRRRGMLSQTLPIFSNLSCEIPCHLNPFHMIRLLADIFSQPISP